MKLIYTFVNPISFLNTWKIGTNTSYFEMAICSGIKAKSFYHKVLNGEKMYTLKRTVPIASMLGLNKKEMLYFQVT